jgi:cytidine deaminase
MRRTRTSSSVPCCAHATGRSSTASTSRTPPTRSACAGDFDLIAITASPCGGCRQWHVEFKVDRVVYANSEGELVEYTPAELLPDTFVL